MMMKRSIQAALIACLLASILGCPNPAGGDPTSSPAGTDATPSPASTPSPAVPAGPSLASITLSGGLVLSPAFNPNTLAYTVRVPNEITSLTVSGTAADPGSSVSSPVTLSGLAVGVAQTATITVTAQDSTARSYAVAATRWPVVPPASENLLLNGGFDDGLFGWSPWAMPGATVDARIEGGELRIEGVATASHNAWDCTVSTAQENNVALRRNKAYTLSFDAYSTVSGTYLGFNFQERGRDLNGDGNLYSSYGSGGFNLTTTKDPYTFSFVMGYPEDGQVEFQIQAGVANAPIYIDNLVLRETGDGSLALAGNWIVDSYMSMPLEITNEKVLAPSIGMDADVLFYDNHKRTMVVRYLGHPAGTSYIGQYQKYAWVPGDPVDMTTFELSPTVAGALGSSIIEDTVQLSLPSNELSDLSMIQGNGSLAFAWFDPTHPDTVSIRVSWDGGSRTVPIGTQTVFLSGLTNGQEYSIQFDSLSASSTVLASAPVNGTPTAAATPGTMEAWLGPDDFAFSASDPDFAAQGYVQLGSTVDISQLDDNLVVTWDVAAAGKYLIIIFRNKFAKVDSVEYLDAGGNVVGAFSGRANGEVRTANRSNAHWSQTEANLLAVDGAYCLLGTAGWHSSIGMQYGAGVDFTRIRIRLLAD